MIHEECGVFGVYAKQPMDVAKMAYYGLYALQHRGQESCGIVVNQDGLFYSKKDLGLVSDVFHKNDLASLPQGKMAIAHCRYGTTGATNRANVQPLEVNHQKGPLALAHNGNLTNAYELRNQLELGGAIFHTTADTETIAYLVTQQRLKTGSIEEAIRRTMDQLEGAYSLLFMSPSKMIAVRDPYGFRPLCYGQCDDGTYVVASESCALDVVNAHFIRDLEPGEMLVFYQNGVQSYRHHIHEKQKHICIFEYIYFARPDSVIDGISIHEARKKAGEVLWESCPVEADAIVGVPDSGLDAALGYSQASAIPYVMGFMKNRYIGRTFISPGQDSRIDKVHIKLNPISSEIKGKRIVLIDDSIVRGTTSAQIVRLLRDAGAKEIHVRISAPPFLNPCFYGTDIDSKENLIACHHSVSEICKIIDADSLEYLPLDQLYQLIGHHQYCDACFSGNYPTAVPSSTAKNRFEQPLQDQE
ncbi:amidophosphoribosyltransferase [Absicoccus intestinalis]|uniref:Amidophosphoribosyltransferase n=1 Tax=Absicoccus intestinalis TaxID=2926319 RepID=A0ABU4WJ20_9FIRM|nr:amidophosphoribosyltransferase [Absicoccus sp. CLA-KB-P134]MDX8416273.1 amidophosphoribosyltransferase [Absicoccus sp. CLA-KB-P134]